MNFLSQGQRSRSTLARKPVKPCGLATEYNLCSSLISRSKVVKNEWRILFTLKADYHKNNIIFLIDITLALSDITMKLQVISLWNEYITLDAQVILLLN